ncbi:MAG: sulfate/thiosulfate transport system permease protein [Solirubrobacterales bacterium]|jgi:sulfate transport system permease protein|nr:sulfate/thiosulfate transport system permease protein [Solirubrobacterales bacterium]
MPGEAATIDPGPVRGASAKGRLAKYGLRGVALGYLFALLLIPVILIFFKAFEDGAAHAWESVTTPEALHAFWLTVLIAGIAVPLNTVFGIACALVLVRHKFRGKAILNGLIDLPFAVSPIVIGLSLVLVYGSVDGWFGPWLLEHGIRVIFSVPGMVLATIFVSLPFVVREVAPVLQEIGDDQEQAAATLGANAWQTFWRITLPSIRWGVTYGVVLATARAIGEFGAVAVVSGKIEGKTETATLLVENQYEHFNVAGAYAAALVLAVMALMVLLAMNLIQRRDGPAKAPSQIAVGDAAALTTGSGKEL